MVMFFLDPIFPSHIFNEGDRDYLSGILTYTKNLVEHIVDY